MSQSIRLQREPDLRSRHSAFPYQGEAADAIKDLEYAAVFHEQGLGKSKIALDVVLYWLSRKLVDSVIIVSKKSLVHNWRREIAMHTHIAPQVLTQDRRANFYAFNSPARLYVTHYEVLRSEEKRISLFLRTRNVAIILDESQKIKNPEAAITKAAFRLSQDFRARLILTGTPIANRPHDLWAQIFFLDNGQSLGQDFTRFRNKLELSGALNRNQKRRRVFEERLSLLYEKIRWFSVRETKRGVALDLPDKEIINVFCSFEARQEECYRAVRDDLRAVVVRDGVPTEDSASGVLKRLLRLVQIASNPALVDESYDLEPGKLSHLRSLLAKATHGPEKVIVWSAFRKNISWLARRCREYFPAQVHGGMSISDRERSLARFLYDDDTRLLLATPGAAKEGLTLTVANRVVFFDRTFSLDDYLQAQDRIHRISQERKCFIYNLIMRNSIDEWVDLLLRSKHLAAQLGQGDINRKQYEFEMSYGFGDVLREILGVEKESAT